MSLNLDCRSEFGVNNIAVSRLASVAQAAISGVMVWGEYLGHFRRLSTNLASFKWQSLPKYFC